MEGPLQILIESFILQLKKLVETNFHDLLDLLSSEERLENTNVSNVSNEKTHFLNDLPLCYHHQFNQQCNYFMQSVSYPMTHYNIVDPKFAKLVGYSLARLFAFPLLHFVVNTKDTDTTTKYLASRGTTNKEQFTIRFYRAANHAIIAVRLEISSCMLNGAFYAICIDITAEIEATRVKQSLNIQKMLRQWLHSIRNASFEQQAKLILDEVVELEVKIGDNAYAEDFKSIRDSVKMLMHSAKTSVGLIDQALESKGLSQQMSVGDFMNTMKSFPHNFASSEGIGEIFTSFAVTRNNHPAEVGDFSSVFVSGDVMSIQSVVDNIVSNAVRYALILSFFLSLLV